MKWAWNIGRISGIQIRVHFTFVLILVWAGYEQWVEDRSWISVGIGVAFLLALFACVLLHELGHAVTAQRFGIRTRDITMLPIGGVARLERIPSKPGQELLVALAGPAVNLVIATLLFLIFLLMGEPEFSEDFPLNGGTFVATLMAINLVIIAFNMLPAFPMDGGRVLRALLATRLSYPKATRIAARMGQMMAGVFVVAGAIGLGPFHQNPFLILIGVFVWIGARQEANMVEFTHALSGIAVAEAMMTEFQTLQEGDDLQRAAELMLAGAQHDFPVLRDGEVVGVLTRGALLQQLPEKGEKGLVSEAMKRDFKVVQASDPLAPLLPQLQQSDCRTMPVLEFGRLVGLLTADNLREFLAIRLALESGQ